MKIFKFGGTALATKGNREKVIDIIKKEEKVIVICSAMGRNGFPYATDTLLNLVNVNNLTSKERARLVSCGEIISSLILKNELIEAGVEATTLSINEVRIKGRGEHDSSSFVSIDNTLIIEALNKCNVVIIPGFIALHEDNEICTFKRGGSDLTSLLLANSFNLDEVYLFKDVEGIYPTYPKINKGLKIYKYISFEEMFLLSDLGFQIVSKDAVEHAFNHKIKINIVNYLTDEIGTIISENSEYHDPIGFTINNNIVKIASFFTNDLLENIKIELKESHIFIKDYFIEGNVLNIQVSSSQVPVIRKMLINRYF
jgi:aspartate kinase